MSKKQATLNLHGKCASMPLQKLREPLSIGTVVVPNRIFMAPMSGVTDAPFRRRGVGHGAGLAVSEMIASGELANASRESLRRMRRDSGNHVHMVQLAGRDPRWMAEAARMAVDCGADIVDINMGCPAKKVIGGYAGSALMREPDHALKIIEAVAAAICVPVTVKMRLGWDETVLNAPDIARSAEAAGAAMITVHGRTRAQFYKGKADWGAISRVKSAVRVPVVANGDVESAADAVAIVERCGADAVMIGRGHYGRPWLAGSIAKGIGKNRHLQQPQTAEAMTDYVIEHYQDMLGIYGVEKGVRHARKHIGWYLDRFAAPLSTENRLSLMQNADPESVIAKLRNADWRPFAVSVQELAA
jgi:tRNA-dihydrouridine synthase B